MTYPLKPSEFLRLLRERKIRPKKSLGQNFLVDNNFLTAIVRGAEIDAKTDVIEIGTGAGHLTDRLAEVAGHVWSFEIDPVIHALASEMLGKRDNLALFNRDGAEFESQVRPRAGQRLIMVSNMPYSTYARLLVAMLATSLPVEACYVMLQRDVADKLRSKMGTPGYGPLGVIVQGLCETKMLMKAGPKMFIPAPRVDSAILRLARVHRDRYSLRSPHIPVLLANLQRLFVQRRKRLKAALKAIEASTGPLPKQAWDYGDRRVGDLDPATLLTLASLL